jgi:hypothetical protein
MKKSAIALIVLALLGVSTGAIAAKAPALTLEQHKQKVLERVGTKHDCANAAQTIEQLQGCFPKGKFGKNAALNFDKHKQKLVERTATHLDCVNAAQTKEQMKACGHKK